MLNLSEAPHHPSRSKNLRHVGSLTAPTTRFYTELSLNRPEQVREWAYDRERIYTVVQLKHQRIALALSAEIRSGRMKRGTQLPGEVLLARQFKVSRNTVRAALSELDSQGLIATRTGKGSFVLFRGRTLDTRNGWAHALADTGVETHARTVSLRLEDDQALAAELQLPGPRFLLVERTRCLADDRPVSHEVARVPATGDMLTSPEKGLLNGSLTETLHQAGLYAVRGVQRIRCRGLSIGEATLLDREVGEPFLDVTRTSFDTGGSFVERVNSLLDPAFFEIGIEFDIEGLG